MKIKCARCSEPVSFWKGSFTIKNENDTEIVCGSCYKVFWALTYGDQADNYENQVINRQVSSQREISARISGLDELGDLIEAQNRTTRAVRSLAITLVAAPLIGVVIAAALFLAIYSENFVLLFLTAIAGLLIAIGTLVAAIEELRRSKVD